MFKILPYLVLAIPLLAASAEPPAPPQFPNLPAGWRVFVSGMHPALFEMMQPENGGKGEFREGVSLLPAAKGRPKGSREFDIREFLQFAGVEFPAGSSAVYYETSHGIVVVAPAKTVEILESVIAPMHPLSDFYPTPAIRVEAMLAEFRGPRDLKLEQLEFNALRTAAGNSWKELQHTSVLTQSGQRGYVISRIQGDAAAEEVRGTSETPDLTKGETGYLFEAEPVLRADAMHVNVNWRFVCQKRIGEKTTRLESTSMQDLHDNATAIVALWPKEGARQAPEYPSKGADHLALLLKVNRADSKGAPILPPHIDSKGKRAKSSPALGIVPCE
jgi:hypothetical protein